MNFVCHNFTKQNLSQNYNAERKMLVLTSEFSSRISRSQMIVCKKLFSDIFGVTVLSFKRTSVAFIITVVLPRANVFQNLLCPNINLSCKSYDCRSSESVTHFPVRLHDRSTAPCKASSPTE